MKTKLFFGLLTFVSLFSYGQNCSRTGTFVGAGDVDVKGTVTLEVQDNGEIHLRLGADFVSDAGPDLDIYLGSGDRVDQFSLKVEALSSLSGEQSYVIPSAVGIDDYAYVTIHCTQYNHHYGAAQLGTKTGGCSTLSVHEAKVQSISATIAEQMLRIEASLSYQNANIQLFDLSGKQVFSEASNIVNGVNNFSFAGLTTRGIVLLKISVSGLTFTEKLILK